MFFLICGSQCMYAGVCQFSCQSNWTLKSTIAGDLVSADPRNFDLRAGLRASAQKIATERKLRQQQVEQLALAVEKAEPCATLDHDTPEDGHCLFHALAARGLLNDILEGLTVSAKRFHQAQQVEQCVQTVCVQYTKKLNTCVVSFTMCAQTC